MKTKATRWGRWLLSLGVLLGVVWGGSASGADLLERVKNQEITQVLRLRVGNSKVLRSTFAITRISVADPEIADIILISEKEVYVNGLAPGVTNLSLWGKSRFTTATVTVEADVSLLKEKLHQILPKEKIGVEAAGDSVVLSGEVSGPLAQDTAMSLAIPFAGGKKEKVINLIHVGGVQQVMCEVRLAEISRTVLDRMGINTTIAGPKGNFGVTNLSAASAGAASSSLTSQTNTSTNSNPLIPSTLSTASVINRAFTAAANPSNFVGGAGFKAGGLLWTMFFDVLKQNNLGRVLAEPNLVTTSGREATFLAGGEYPIPVPQSGVGGGTTITIDYKKFGVMLSFTPTVLDEGKIAMKVNPEVSALDFANAITTNGFVIPALTVRRMSTHLEVKDGQTFAMAGLLKDEDRNIISKVPLIGDVPILGNLFRSSNWQKAQTELVVLVTPHIAKPLAPNAARLPTDKWAAPSDAEMYLLGLQQARPKAVAPPQATPPSQALPQGFGMQKMD
ncbi:MAG: type II and III secretion system protein family protein [Deltaproteobacteria bacterium]|nr:type II and III secretion system protein family protein [Deltaproteobacteria bacterium]